MCIKEVLTNNFEKARLQFKHEKDNNNNQIHREVDLSGPVTAATFTYDLIENGRGTLGRVRAMIRAEEKGGES